jgi:hypothetical protein
MRKDRTDRPAILPHDLFKKRFPPPTGQGLRIVYKRSCQAREDILKKHKPLNPRQRAYLKARIKGATKKKAALAAGYAESTAENAKQKIEAQVGKSRILSMMRRAGLDMKTLLGGLKEQTRAEAKVLSASVKSISLDAKKNEVEATQKVYVSAPDNPARNRALELAFRLNGSLGPEFEQNFTMNDFRAPETLRGLGPDELKKLLHAVRRKKKA